MIDVHMDAATMARVRLAISPASEALQLLALASSSRRHPVLGKASTPARDALGHRDVALVAAVLQPDGTGYTPDLLTPKPPSGSLRSILDEQLDAIAATGLERTVDEIANARFPTGRMPRQVRAALDSGTFATRAAAGLAAFWRAAFADGWPALRATLEADLAQRAEAMARNGIGQVLGHLHPRLSFGGDRLHFASRFTGTEHLRGAELVLSPTVLGWPLLALQTCDPANAVIMYPAGGLAGRREAAGQLGHLLGSSRAVILGELGVPRSTAELSDRIGLAPATVSYHLGVLFRAGLLLRSRDGHHVRYRRSAHGQLLCESGG
jgi:DNA-binding transcriptional ArsR family regulator